jgi:hypothetical protein
MAARVRPSRRSGVISRESVVDVRDCICMRLGRHVLRHVSSELVARAPSQRRDQGCREAGAGLIGTIAALVLGLLIASANSTFETQGSQVQQLTANIVVLDRILAQYGPETVSARNMLRRAVAAAADRIWRENGRDSEKAEPFEASAAGLSFYDEILKLEPKSEAQRALQAKAIGAAEDLAKTRLLLFAEAGRAIPMPFLGWFWYPGSPSYLPASACSPTTTQPQSLRSAFWRFRRRLRFF